jgi:hypothetical protein
VGLEHRAADTLVADPEEDARALRRREGDIEPGTDPRSRSRTSLVGSRPATTRGNSSDRTRPPSPSAVEPPPTQTPGASAPSR